MTSKIQADVLKNVNSSVDNLTLGTSGQVTVGGSLNIGGNYNITGSLTLGSALSVANGGTGLQSLTAGYIPYGNGTSAFGNDSAFTFNGNTLTVKSTNYTNGTGNGQLVLLSTTAAAADAGATLVLGGQSTPLANWPFASISGRATNTTNYAGYLQFNVANSGGGIAEAMRIASDGTVGIGTTSPQARLDLNGSINVTNDSGLNGSWSGLTTRYLSGNNTTYLQSLSLSAGSVTGGKALSFDAYELYFRTISGSSFTERMRLDASGNLGLGVTPSAWSAGKAFEIGSLGTGLSVGYGLGFNVTSNAYYNGAFYYGVNGPSTRHAQQSGEHRWFTAPPGTAGNPITFTQAMTLDASGNLGIGTSSPTQKLHIQGTTGILLLRSTDPATATAAPFITAPVTTGFSDTPVYSFWYSGSGISFPAAETLGFRTNSAERMRIDSSGNVGIGTSSPQETLTVAKSSSGSLGPILSSWNTAANANNNAAAIGMRTSSDFTGANIYGGLIKTILTNAAGHANEMSFSLYSDGAGGLAERMRIDTSGNVGIGVNVPNAKLDILTTASTRLLFTERGTGGNVIDSVNGANTAYSQFLLNGSSLVFATGAANRAVIDSSGNLLVGTTSAGGGSGSQFRVFSSTAGKKAGEFYIDAASSTATAPVSIAKYDNNSTTSQIFVAFAINQFAAGSGYITANGANAATFTSSSDARLKENIVVLDSQLENICLLKPSEFDFKDGSGHQIGFIAQEIAQVYPDCVAEDNRGMLLISGWSKTEARLVKAIQELAAKVQALEAKVQ